MLFLVLSSCHPEESLSVCFTGDLLLDRGVREYIDRKGTDSLFKYVKPVFNKYDAVIVNLECPVTDISSPVHKKYIFRANPEWLSAFAEAGITHAAMANNHTYDQGRDEITATYQNLHHYGIQAMGYGSKQEEACSPVIIQNKNIELAIFNSVLLPLENWMPLSNAPGMCQASAGELVVNIRLYKEKYPQCYVVVLLHWGGEYALHPVPEQRLQAYQLLNAGADAVVGHHPHVVQDIEWYKGKPIFYSLGNFVFDSTYPDAQNGLIAGFTFYKDSISVRSYHINIKGVVPELKIKNQACELNKDNEKL